MKSVAAIWIAIGVYCLWCVLLILQKPGLQYDEAFLEAGAVHMLHPAAPYHLAEARDIWACPLQHCLPLMGGGSRYVGAIKDYLSLPLFAMFGPRVSVIRLLSMMLGALGIWGISKLVAERIGRKEAAAVALILALNPAYTAMTVFDNNAVAAMMAGFGLVCVSLANYLRRESWTAAFLFGLAIGFGIWTRANFVWIVAAGGVAALLVFRRQILVPVGQWIAILCGGVTGGLPFLIYQVISGAGTWKAQAQLAASRPILDSLRYRIMMLQEVFLSDGEHRRMWGGGALPKWQLWVFPLAVTIACVICLVVRGRKDRPQHRDAQFAALTLIFLTVYLLLTGIEVAEHHLMVLIPFGASIVVVACSILQSRYRSTWILSASLGLIYVGSACYWQVAAIRGLKNSGGIGMWSNAVFDLARRLDAEYPHRVVKILDWGLQANLFVLTNSRFESAEIFSSGSRDISRQNRSWNQEIRDGGIFLLNGPESREDPEPSAGFLHALDEAGPIVPRRYSIPQRNGAIYAEVIEVNPNTIRDIVTKADLSRTLSMGDPRTDQQLRGFYQIEAGAWRWTSRQFAVILPTPDGTSLDAELSVRLNVPDALIQKYGTITLTARLGDHVLPAETYTNAGDFTFRRDMRAAWFTPHTIRIDFSLDRALPPAPPERRELGIVVRTIAINEK